jgi:predicted  nucleic acid-binding Zn-ribbon protein
MLTELTCVHCGKVFTRESWDIKRGRIKFCGVKCSRANQAGKPKLKTRRRIIRVCPVCKKEFEKGGRAGKRTQTHCSNQCRNAAKIEKSKGKIYFHDAGYRMTRVNGRPKFEHRLVAEKTLGRPLLKSEVVHHNNENKLDNRPENLTVMSQSQHRALIDYLAGLWIKDHLDIVNKITRDFVSST